MAKIIAPNKEFTGVSASVSFCNGIGETEDPRLIAWFKDHGYEVDGEDTGQEDPLAKMSIEELKAYAVENSIEIGNSSSQNGILKKIRDAEKGGEVDGEDTE